MVEFNVSIQDDEEPNDITFEIPYESIRVDGSKRDIGKVTSYCTQEYIE